MISLIVFICSLLFGIIGIAMLIRASKKYKMIFFGSGISWQTIAITAVMNGLAVYLIMLSPLLGLMSLDISHLWTIKSTLIFLALPIPVVILVILGSLWQFFTAEKFREFIFDILTRNKNKNDKR